MYSLIVADDEANLCNGIKSTLERHCPEINVINTFYNGTDLLEFLKSNTVDIVICDIRMPGATGMEIAEYVSKNKPDTSVIIISGYKEFEYAKNAIDYRVSAFLVKPFAFSDLIKSVRSIESVIDSRCRFQIKNDEIFLKNWIILKNEITAIKNSENFSTDNMFSKIKELNVQSYRVCEIRYTDDSNSEISEQALEDFGEIFTEEIITCFVEYTPSAYVCVLLYKNHDEITEVINSFLRAVKTHYGVELNYEYLLFQNLSEWQRHCLSKQIIDLYFRVLDEKNASLAYEAIKDRVDRLSAENLSFLYSYIYKYTGVELVKKSIDSVSPKDIKELLFDMSDIITANDMSKSDILIQKAKSYIEQNYSNPNLSLITVADYLKVNAAYLSRIIKKKTDKRFVEIILEARMQKAKELLRDPDISIKKISECVGYNQVPYFRKQFTQYFGITPTAYRNSYL